MPILDLAYHHQPARAKASWWFIIHAYDDPVGRDSHPGCEKGFSHQRGMHLVELLLVYVVVLWFLIMLNCGFHWKGLFVMELLQRKKVFGPCEHIFTFQHTSNHLPFL